MANSNPAFSRNPAFSANGYRPTAGYPTVPAQTPAVPTPDQLQQHLDIPSATQDQMGRMTYEDTIVKTIIAFGILLAGAAVGWFFPIVALPAAIVGLVLGLVNTFKRRPVPGLVLAYAGVEGLFVGGISNIYADIFGKGIVPMAVFGTLAVVGVTLALFASGKVRASKRATRIFLVLIIGYAAFSLVNVVLMLTGVTSGMFGVNSMNIPGTSIPIGVPLGLLAVALGCYSLVLDFDSVQQGVRNGAPRIFAWSAAFGFMVTVVWLYLEILRLIALLMGRR